MFLGSVLKEGRILWDNRIYLCLGKLLPNAVKRPMTSVKRRMHLCNVCIAGSLCMARGSRQRKISFGGSLMQVSHSNNFFGTTITSALERCLSPVGSILP